MKKILIPLFVMAALLSCKKTNETTFQKSLNQEMEEIGSANNIISCKIDGKPWTSNNVIDDASNKFSVTLVGLNKSQKNSFCIFYDRALAVTGAVLPYQFKMGELATATFGLTTRDANYNEIPEKTIVISEGKITITKVSKTNIEGTFEGSNKNHKITNGKFSMEYTKVW
jgi:hypothetical protein